MELLARMYTDGNDAYHSPVALTDLHQTSDINTCVERFFDLQSRAPALSDAEAHFALVCGLRPDVQVHMLGQHHVTSLAAAPEKLRVYSHARRGLSYASDTPAGFGSSLDARAPMDLDHHSSSRQMFNNLRSDRS